MAQSLAGAREKQHCRLATGGVGGCWGWGGAYLFGRLQQRRRLSRSRLLDHVVEKAVPVLQQHVGLVVLLDSSGGQNLQSGAVLQSNRFPESITTLIKPLLSGRQECNGITVGKTSNYIIVTIPFVF